MLYTKMKAYHFQVVVIVMGQWPNCINLQITALGQMQQVWNSLLLVLINQAKLLVHGSGSVDYNV